MAHISEAFVFYVLKTLLRSCVPITIFHPAAVKLYLHGLIASSVVKEISTAFSDMVPNVIRKRMISYENLEGNEGQYKWRLCDE